MFRAPWMMSVAPLLGLLAASPAAAIPLAEPPVGCASDDECAQGSFCDRSSGSSGDVDGPSGISEPAECEPGTACDAPVPVPAPPPSVSHCAPLPQGFCEEQGDCATGLECRKYSYWDGCDDFAAYDAGVPEPGPRDAGTVLLNEPTSAKAAPGAAEPPPSGSDGGGCTSHEVIPRYGRCVMPVTECESDAQCLDGLSCVGWDWGGGYADAGTAWSYDAGQPDEPSPASGASDEAPVADPIDVGGYDGGVGYADAGWGGSSAQCGFREQECTTNDECAGGYECATVYQGSGCTGSGGCSSDGDCEPVAPPVCEDFYGHLCYPKKTDCVTDAECTEGWKCVEFTNAEGGLATPEWWKTSEAVKSCVPAGFAVLAGSADGLPYAPRQVSSLPEGLDPVSEGDNGGPKGVDGNGYDAGSSAPGTDPGTGIDTDPVAKPGAGGGAPAAGGPGKQGPAPSTDSNEGSGSSNKDSGICAVGFSGGSSTSAMGLLTGLLGLVIRRRRRRA